MVRLCLFSKIAAQDMRQIVKAFLYEYPTVSVLNKCIMSYYIVTAIPMRWATWHKGDKLCVVSLVERL